MVAYSFKKRFVAPIQVGLGTLPGVPRIHTAGSIGPNAQDVVEYIPNPNPPRPKRQTIRADRKRHARAGEDLQLYYGMRTKQCELIGRARCIRIRAIVLTFERNGHVAIGGLTHETSKGSYVEPESHYAGGGLDTFAQMDGFADWNEMLLFWNVRLFIGQLIEWEPL